MTPEQQKRIANVTASLEKLAVKQSHGDRKRIFRQIRNICEDISFDATMNFDNEDQTQKFVTSLRDDLNKMLRLLKEF